MRSLISLAIVASFFALAVATPPNTPPDGTPIGDKAEPMCLLDGLLFSNPNLYLVPEFRPNWFHYQCGCFDWSKIDGPVIIMPHMMDNESTSEITFNGVKINFRDLNPPSGISNYGTAIKSPDLQSNPITFLSGRNNITIGVGCNGYGLPNLCYYQYNITCTKPPESHVVGDPQFTGLRGQSYQIHGVAGEIYNIVSDSDLQYNSRFVFLQEGKCPVVNGKKQKACWSHPGSYLGELGLKTRTGERIQLVAGSADNGFALVEVDGKPVEVSETILLADGSVSLNSTHVATIQSGNWRFVFENSDMFVNQHVKVLDERKLRSHGLLGQTWREVTYPNAIRHIQGQVDDYVIRDEDIFGDNFVYNSFN